MSLQESELQNICSTAANENYGEGSLYEHIHTSFYHEEALGLIKDGDNTHLIQFTFNQMDLESVSVLHTFTEEHSKVTALCEKLLSLGRTFGNKESI